MQSSQQNIISRVHECLVADKSVLLCTILKTWGSSPRPIGSMMACTLEGELVGSISGGCIEEDFLEQLQDGSLKSRYDEQGKPFLIRYGINAEEQARLKLPCGGQLHVLLELIAPDQQNRQVFRTLEQALESHQRISGVVNLGTGEINYKDEVSAEAVLADGKKSTTSLSPG